MLIIPRGSKRQASRKLKRGEREHYELLEKAWRENTAKKAEVEFLQSRSDQSLSQAIREAIDPKNRLSEAFDAEFQFSMRSLHEFQDKRNRVPSPTWNNELKDKFGKKGKAP